MLIKYHIADEGPSQSYLVHMSKGGLSRTCWPDSAITEESQGVIGVKSQPGDSVEKVPNNTLQRLAEINSKLVHPLGSRKRTELWDRVFKFGHTQLLLLSTPSSKELVENTLILLVLSEFWLKFSNSAQLFRGHQILSVNRSYDCTVNESLESSQRQMK